MTNDFEARIHNGYNIAFTGMFPSKWKIATVTPISGSKAPPIRMSRRILAQLLVGSEGGGLGGGGVAVEDSTSKLGSVSDISNFFYIFNKVCEYIR